MAPVMGGFSAEVVSRFGGSEEVAEPHRERLRRKLPNDGHIRLLTITDRQFGRLEVFYGNERGQTESKPEQLQFFEVLFTSSCSWQTTACCNEAAQEPVMRLATSCQPVDPEISRIPGWLDHRAYRGRC